MMPIEQASYSHLIESCLTVLAWSIPQGDPFGNTGHHFKNDTFEVEAFNWNEDEDQPYNFKWKEIEVSWYKYFPRGLMINYDIQPNRILTMLFDCLQSLGYRMGDVEHKGCNI